MAEITRLGLSADGPIASRAIDSQLPPHPVSCTTITNRASSSVAADKASLQREEIRRLSRHQKKILDSATASSQTESQGRSPFAAQELGGYVGKSRGQYHLLDDLPVRPVFPEHVKDLDALRHLGNTAL